MIGSFRLPISVTSSGDTTAPTILSATVEDANPNKLVVVFSEVVTITDITGLTITGDATPTLSAPTGSGTDIITFTLSTALTNGQSVTLNVASSNTIKDAANNALAAATKAITNNVAVTYEAETTSYMNTIAIPDNSSASIYTGVSNNGVWLAVNEYITDLKTAVIYNKLHYNYLRVGGDITKQSVDLIDPTRSGQYFGSWVFGKDGATANGTNCYFKAIANPLVLAPTSNNFGISVVINSSTESSSVTVYGIYSGSGTDMRVQLYLNTSGINPFLGKSVGIYPLVLTGFFSTSRTSDIAKSYLNGVEKLSSSQSGTVLPDAEVYEGASNWAYNGTVANYIECDLGVTAYHQNLTASETLAFSNAVSKLETALGRKRY